MEESSTTPATVVTGRCTVFDLNEYSRVDRSWLRRGDRFNHYDTTRFIPTSNDRTQYDAMASDVPHSISVLSIVAEIGVCL